MFSTSPPPKKQNPYQTNKASTLWEKKKQAVQERVKCKSTHFEVMYQKPKYNKAV